jgi:predicted RNA-binding Zn ribbon-like protein
MNVDKVKALLHTVKTELRLHQIELRNESEDDAFDEEEQLGILSFQATRLETISTNLEAILTSNEALIEIHNVKARAFRTRQDLQTIRITELEVDKAVQVAAIKGMRAAYKEKCEENVAHRVANLLNIRPEIPKDPTNEH